MKLFQDACCDQSRANVMSHTDRVMKQAEIILTHLSILGWLVSVGVSYVFKKELPNDLVTMVILVFIRTVLDYTLICMNLAWTYRFLRILASFCIDSIFVSLILSENHTYVLYFIPIYVLEGSGFVVTLIYMCFHMETHLRELQRRYRSVDLQERNANREGEEGK
jgi:hypothetical protein